MLQKFIPLRLKQTLFFTICSMLLFNMVSHAQCSWLPHAPFITQPPVKYYNKQCGSGNAVWISRCSTAKALANFDNSSACAPPSDTNNYTYYGGSGGMLCKAQAGSKVDLYFTVALTADNSSIVRIGVWIDWNHNLVYEEGPTYSELVTLTGTSSLVTKSGIVGGSQSPAGTHMIQFEIPEYAKNGLTRMRIRIAGNGSGTSLSPPGFMQVCGLFDHGECEEYDLDIVSECRTPDVISVSDVTCKGADICWSLLKHMETFDYWVGTTPLPPNPAATQAPLSHNNCRTVPNTTYASILPETKYYIAVRNVCDTIFKTWQQYHNSGWAIDSFTTLPCCDAPVNLRIHNITSTTADVSWDPVYTAGRYEYVVVTSKNNLPSKGTILTGTSLHIAGLTHSKTYYFCVRALCSPTPLSDWSCEPLATENTTSVSSVNPETVNMNVYPNPVKDMLTVTTVEAYADAQVGVTDITGKIIHTQVVTGKEISISTAGWAKGIYLLHYQSSAGYKVVKITKE